MAKALTKSQIAASIAEKKTKSQRSRQPRILIPSPSSPTSKRVTPSRCRASASSCGNRPARTMTMQFGTKKGQSVTVPAKRVVKFRVSKAAKDAILASK